MKTVNGQTENIDAAGKRGVGSIANHKAASQTNARLTKKMENHQVVEIK